MTVPRALAAPAPLTAYLCLAGSMALVGSYVGLSKLLVAVFPVLLLAWLRFGIAAVAMLHWVRRPPGEAPLTAHDKQLLFWQSFLGNFMFSVCMLFGVQATSAVAAGVVMAAMPAAVAILSRITMGERIAPRVQGGIACAAAGIALLALAKSPAGNPAAAGAAAPWWGYALLVGAVVCEASFTVIGKRLTGKLSARRISAIVNLWGLALVTPFGLWQARTFDFSTISAAIWGLLLFYALTASVVTAWLWLQGLRQVPAAQAGVFSVMLPVSAALVGVVFLGEPFGAGHLAAFGLALAGLLLATWPGRR